MKRKSKYLFKKRFNKLMLRKKKKYDLNSIYYFASKIRNIIDYSRKKNTPPVPRYKLLKNYRDKRFEEDSFKLGDVFSLRKRFKKRLFFKRRVFNKLIKSKRILSNLEKTKIKRNYPLASFLLSHIINYKKFLKSFRRWEIKEHVLELERKKFIKSFTIKQSLNDYMAKKRLEENLGEKLVLRNLKKARSYKRIFSWRKNIVKYKKKEITCLIILKHVETNFYIIVTDLKGRVIKYVTAGRVSFSKNVRKKLSYYLVFPMMYRVLDKLKELKIRYIRFHIRNRGGSHVRKVKEFLIRKKFIIDQWHFSKPIPHHIGQRKRKLKRK